MSDNDKIADYPHVKEIIGDRELVERLVRYGGGFIFSLYLSEEFVESDIDCLDLSVRAGNCLRRAGIMTVGDLCKRVDRSSDLKGIRNCGRKSIVEIMDKMFYYNYLCLSKDERDEFVAETIERNKNRL